MPESPLRLSIRYSSLGELVPAPSKVQDMREALRWLEEGRTYQWIVEEYRRKYGVETTISMWAALRRRHGIDPRIVRDEALIPWAVKPEHRHAHAVSMLRAEARRRAGKTLTPLMKEMLDAWLAGLDRDGTVVDYDPDSESGWRYVERRPGVDLDLIREPERRTGRRWREREASGGEHRSMSLPRTDAGEIWPLRVGGYDR